MNADMTDVYQQAAKGFLARHHGEHLTDNQLLFNRAVTHLTTAFDAPQAIAENVVARAYGELRGSTRFSFALDLSSAHVAVLVDAETSRHYVLAASQLGELMLAKTAAADSEAGGQG